MLAALIITASIAVGQTEQTTPNVPSNVLQELTRLVGDWQVEGKVNDDEVKGTMSVKWGPGKHMLVWTGTWSGPEGDSVGAGIDGWDAAQEVIVTSEFWSDGWSHHRRYRIAAPNVWETTEVTGATGEGKRLTGTVRVAFSEPERFTFTASNRVDGDANEKQVVLHFRRK